MLNNEIKRVRRDLNLIPLINVIFLLLTFFMVAGTLERADPFALNLPEAGINGKKKPPVTTNIYLSKDGKIAVNNDLVSREDFPTIINTLLLENKGKKMVIKSDAETPSKSLLWAMRAVESAGVEDVSIVTKVAK